MLHTLRRRGPLSALATVVLASVDTASAAPVFSYLYTGQTGAQVQVDTLHTQHWSVAGSAGLDNFIGGRFKMKAGPATVETVTFLFFAGTYQDYLDSTYTSLMSVTKTAAEVGYADFTFIDFFANSPLSLLDGTLYTGVLYSDAPQPESRSFFIKESFEFIVNQSPAGIVPTPPAALLAAAGILASVRRRRR